MEERSDEFEQVMVDELGMPIALAADYQVTGPIEAVNGFADRCEELDRVEEVNNSLIVQEPVGVCAFINPWNYPLHQIIGKVAPALAAGCTMIVKAASQTPSHAFILAEIIDSVGVPAEQVLAVHHHQSFHQIFQFPDVPRPTVGTEDREDFPLDPNLGFPHLLGKPFQEMFCEKRYVVLAFAQRGNPDRHDIEPIE